ncbi:MAG TPA: fumarylacetoacetate hydrolase family protein [Devosiaceae bacterium]|jgi:2-keto-4-pentenoate hydratase
MQFASDDNLAAKLAHNRFTGTPSPLRFDVLSSRSDASAVQLEALGAYSPDFRGYALTGTKADCRVVLGLSEPVFGPIPSRDLFGTDEHVALPLGLIGAQCELVFTLGRSYPDRDESIDRESVALAIVACRPSISLVGRRTVGAPRNDIAAIADFGLHVATICGKPVRTDWLELSESAMTARIDGKTVMTGMGNGICHHPLDAVAWLARKLVRGGKQIGAGDIVATGSCVPILQILPGQRLSVAFAGVGEVSCSFV